MDKLYIATSSLNLNSILATESLSPEAFYRNRDFGYKRYTKVEPNPFSNSLLAYNKIPDFQINESDFDDYPLIIEISSELIKDEDFKNPVLVGDIKVFQLTRTIYFHPNRTKFLFFNEKDKRTALIKTEPSIETKLLPVYNKRISLIENNNSFKWDKSIISSIQDLQNTELFKEIDRDSRVNKLKGFYFSYLIGMILSATIQNKIKKEEYEIFANSIINLLNQRKSLPIIDVTIIEELENLKLNISKYISKLTEDNRKKIDPLLLIENLNFNGYKITQFTDVFFENDDIELYRIVINDIIDYPINDIQSFKEEKVNLAFKIGGILKEYVRDWDGSRERDYFNGLMDNIESYQPFNLKSHSSLILQSIALFIQKGEEPEKLIENLKKNDIADFRIALGLWGSIFGFSAIPKTLTNTLFENKYIETTRQLYQDVQVKLHEFNAEDLSSFESLIQIPSNNKDTEQLEMKNDKEKTRPHNTTNGVTKNISSHKVDIKKHPNEKLKCPKCGADMVLRDGKYGNFYGCSKYGYSASSCDGTLQLKDIPVRNETTKVLSTVILEYININGHSKLSDLIPYIKDKINIKYNVANIELHINGFLLEELEFAKLEQSNAKAVKIREKGMFG